MKRVYTFIVCALCTSALFSCTQDRTEDVEVNAIGKDVIYARVNDNDDDRVQLNEKRQMTWTAGDTVFVVGYSNKVYKLQGYKFDGATGDRSGSFTAVPELDLCNNGSMYNEYYTNKEAVQSAYWWRVDGDNNCPADFAVSPFRGFEVDWWEYLYCCSPNTAQQSYTVGSSDPNTNILVGESVDGKNFEFKNLLGFLRISLTGDKKVKSLVVTENTGAPIGGKFLFNIAKFVFEEVDENEILWESIDNKTECFKSSSITLDCGDGVQLNDTPTDFYFSVVPIVMSKGFTLVVNFTDGSTFVQDTSKKIDIQRNHIKPMKAVKIGDVDYQTITIMHTGTTLSVPEIMGAKTVSGSVTIIEPVSGFINWGDGSTSILGLLTSYDYLDGASSHKIVISVKDANSIKFNGIEGITELDLTNF